MATLPLDFVDIACAEMDAWLTESGMVESRLGVLACGNVRAVRRIRDGSARIHTLQDMVVFIRNHYPKAA